MLHYYERKAARTMVRCRIHTPAGFSLTFFYLFALYTYTLDHHSLTSDDGMYNLVWSTCHKLARKRTKICLAKTKNIKSDFM